MVMPQAEPRLTMKFIAVERSRLPRPSLPGDDGEAHRDRPAFSVAFLRLYKVSEARATGAALVTGRTARRRIRFSRVVT